MPRKKGDKPGGETRRRRGPKINRRTIKREGDSTQLLERGEGPTAEEQIDPAVDSPSEITSEGGPGTDAAYRMGGPVGEAGGPPSSGERGTGGEGGYSTLGGGVYPDEGPSEEAPRYGDWRRHSSGATSGARGQEGFGNPGEGTWGEERRAAERREEQGPSGRRSAPERRRRSDESLAQEIREILTTDHELEATAIEVKVEGGAVTIAGEVADPDARLLAEELVESVVGVREVRNRLRVAR